MAVETNADITPAGFLGHDGSVPGKFGVAAAKALLNLATADLSDAGELAAADYADLYRSGAGAPTVSARFVGDIWINTTPNPDTVYQALGPSIGGGPADWTLMTTLAIGSEGDILAVVSSAEAWFSLAANQTAVKNTGNTAIEARLQKHAYMFSGAFTADGTYQLPPWPDIPCTGVDVQTHTWGGTCSIKIQKGGSDINGYGSAVAQTTSVTTTTSTETYTKGAKMQVVISSASSLTGLAVTINAKRTGN